MTYLSTIKHIIDLEDEVFIDTDASIHKVTQENWEFQEALLEWDAAKIVDEAADAVTNTLIATYRVIWEIPEEEDFFCSEDIVNLTITNYKRNDALQTYRGIYTRNTKTIDKEQILERTKQYVSWVLWYASAYDTSVTISSLIQHSLWKITWRMDMYKPEIDIKDYISTHDFKWVDYKHIWPILANPEINKYVIQQMTHWAKWADVIMVMDARWFLHWNQVAINLWIPCILARKPGKLPWKLIEQSYEKEYWPDTLSIMEDDITPWQKVAIIDDLLATAWTAQAWGQLIEKAWGTIHWNYFIIELDYLNGREKLSWDVKSIVSY